MNCKMNSILELLSLMGPTFSIFQAPFPSSLAGKPMLCNNHFAEQFLRLDWAVSEWQEDTER